MQITDIPDLPHDEAAERALLGAALAEPECLWRALEVVGPAAMFLDGHRMILAAMQDLALNGSGPPDLVSLAATLRDRGELDRVGGVTYIAGLTDSLPDVAGVEHYAKIVQELAQRRAIITMSHRASTRAAAGGDSVDVQRQLLADLAAMDGRRSVEQAWLGDALREEAAKVLELHTKGAGALGLLTGIVGIDALLQGLKPEMYVIAARPRIGKSTLADQIGVHVARTTGLPVLCMFTEMSVQQRARRQLAAAVGVSVPRLQTGSLTPAERRDLEHVTGSDARVRLIQCAGRTAAEVRTMALRFEAQHGRPSMIIVDYLQQLSAANPRSSEVEITGEKSRQLQQLAMASGVPVLALSQLNRASDTERRPPRLIDLRGSGDIEQDAYAVMFMHRPDENDPFSVSLLVAKHKDGPEGKVDLRFVPERMCFEDAGARYEEPERVSWEEQYS